jgi:hypothetical protein
VPLPAGDSYSKGEPPLPGDGRGPSHRTELTLRFLGAFLATALLYVVEAPPSIAQLAGAEAERRALVFLAREVPRWPRENHCFSCHNNGDAARALLAAANGSLAPPAAALDETIGWLAHPSRWEKNGGNGPFNDKRLARLQFALALASAVEAGRIRDRVALLEASRGVAGDQSADGSWPVDQEELVGSPATYGRPLATALATRLLRNAAPREFAGPITKGEAWLRRRTVQNVLDASAVLIGLTPGDSANLEPRRRGLELLKRAQTSEGGWGPFPNSAPEAFDTALALLALSGRHSSPEARAPIARGRRFLVAMQLEDGSWPGTTRPSGGESYAQRLSTAGWATLALLATR